MSKAKQVPSDKWEKKVMVGIENGERVYETVYGESEEEVEKKAKAVMRKRQMARQSEWQKENMDRMSVVFNKGTKERIQSLGETANKFIREAVEKELQARGV